MGADQHHDWHAIAASTLEWWRDAGVDMLVEDDPRDWLARRPAPPPPVPGTQPAAEAPPPLPASLTDFIAWRLGPEAPERTWGNALVAPEGDAAAPLMVVIDMPGDEALLDGAAGRLFDRMLAAIGFDRSHIYLASLAVARPLGGRIAPEAEPRLVELLRHHVAIVAPRHILLLGQAPSRALIGTDGVRTPNSLHAINLQGVTVAAVSSLSPRLLLDRPGMKAQAWRDLQALKGDMR